MILYINYDIIFVNLYLFSKLFYKDYRLDRGEYARKMGLETKNI
jgi:hypothetical protein